MSVGAKAKMLLDNGRVQIIKITPTSIFARVQGSEPNPYRTTVFRNGNWDCECKYFQTGVEDDHLKVWECSHALAVKLTTVYKEWILQLTDRLVEEDEKNSHHTV